MSEPADGHMVGCKLKYSIGKFVAKTKINVSMSAAGTRNTDSKARIEYLLNQFLFLFYSANWFVFGCMAANSETLHVWSTTLFVSLVFHLSPHIIRSGFLSRKGDR